MPACTRGYRAWLGFEPVAEPRTDLCRLGMELVSSVPLARLVPARVLGPNYLAVGCARRVKDEVLAAAGNTGVIRDPTSSFELVAQEAERILVLGKASKY